MNIFDRLRTKPQHERKQIAIATTVTIFGVIMFVWVTLLSLKSDPEVALTASNKTVSPFQSLGAIFNEGIEGAKASISSAKDALAPLMTPPAPARDDWQATIPVAPAEAGAAEEATSSDPTATSTTVSNVPAVLP